MLRSPTELRGVNIRDIGDNFSGKIVGRDLNETVNNIGQAVSNIQKAIIGGEPRGKYEFTLDNVFERQNRDVVFKERVNQYESEGWSLFGVTSDYNGTDAMILIFRRPVAG